MGAGLAGSGTGTLTVSCPTDLNKGEVLSTVALYRATSAGVRVLLDVGSTNLYYLTELGASINEDCAGL